MGDSSLLESDDEMEMNEFLLTSAQCTESRLHRRNNLIENNHITDKLDIVRYKFPGH